MSTYPTPRASTGDRRHTGPAAPPPAAEPTPDPARAAPAHLLSVDSFVRLASGDSDPATLGTLRNGQRSKRLLLLRMVHDAAAADPAVMGPLPPVRRAWELLERARRADPAAFDTVLMYPSTGVWASRVLRRVRGAVSGETPLWVEVGHVHALSVAAAIRAGIAFDAAVPVRDGRFVHLPSLGTVNLLGAFGRGSLGGGHHPHIATVHRAGGGSVVSVTMRGACVLVPEDPRKDARGWAPVPTVTAATPAGTLSLCLDDADPYGTFLPGRPVHRPGPQWQQRWRRLLVSAWELLAGDDPEAAAGLAGLMRTVVPLAPAANDRPFSASSPEAFGGVMMALPRTTTTLAVSLVHEYQHTKLGALLDLVPLHHEGGGATHYAPWRGDPRPISGLLQGVYAHLGIVRFWRHRMAGASGHDAGRARFEYLLWRDGTAHVLAGLRGCDELTELGARFVDVMRDVVTAWCEEDATAPEAGDARAVARDHWGMWRLRHTEAPADAVARLADRWILGLPPSRADREEPSRVRVDALTAASSLRTHLLRSRWDNPEEFAWMCRRPDVAGVPRADLAFVAGDFAGAAHLYADALTASDSPRYGRDTTSSEAPAETHSAWVGLGLALAGSGDDDAARVLLTRPELVRAVHVRLTAASERAHPVALAGWLGTAL
ncbi:HEXXH motif-containing putative peptide modification protein [Yinghuangia sp. ASG 101]|uniref:HEXXH motif domain-containing protein n=1 Tax=Yinghuangia sp. ASG 101 TaxID=2896848 RepID=UPI001E572AD1|nr:HEXXH motif domain-containing protein [Yinghuangia sp. ASG 101]UGQ12634.1 HEXXH motif-containing putative peptide modification protein [Yinghuangia sp. ASG 101]